MKREFNIGDVAYMSKGKRVRGILNYNKTNEQYKDFTIRFKHPVEIIQYQKADDRICGGWIYDCRIEYNGVFYRVDCISQFELCSKKLWAQNVQLEKRIAELINK